jgi:hypothetical protein
VGWGNFFFFFFGKSKEKVEGERARTYLFRILEHHDPKKIDVLLLRAESIAAFWRWVVCE